jgi:hypothetical protein
VNSHNNKKLSPIYKLIKEYVKRARTGLKKRWKLWQFDMDDQKLHEVVGGLLGRQVTLSTQLAMNPGMWNNHSAPIILRCMVDIYINLCWISKDPKERALKFFKHGLGEWKLSLEHRKEQIRRDGGDPDTDELIMNNESLLNSQRHTAFTDVDLGHWAEMNTRKLAEESGCIDFYNYAYAPFSAAVHSTWRHLRMHNLIMCTNPLHKGHLVLIDFDYPTDPFYWDLAVKYLDKTFKLFDETFIKKSGEYIRPWLQNKFTEFSNRKTHKKRNSAKTGN